MIIRTRAQMQREAQDTGVIPEFVRNVVSDEIARAKTEAKKAQAATKAPSFVTLRANEYAAAYPGLNPEGLLKQYVDDITKSKTQKTEPAKANMRLMPAGGYGLGGNTASRLSGMSANKAGQYRGMTLRPLGDKRTTQAPAVSETPAGSPKPITNTKNDLIYNPTPNASFAPARERSGWDDFKLKARGAFVGNDSIFAELKEFFTGVDDAGEAMAKTKWGPNQWATQARRALSGSYASPGDYAIIKQAYEVLKNSPEYRDSELLTELKNAEKSWGASPIRALGANTSAAAAGIAGNLASLLNSFGADKIPFVKDVTSAAVKGAKAAQAAAQEYNDGGYGQTMGAITQGVVSLLPYFFIGTAEAGVQASLTAPKYAKYLAPVIKNPSFWYSLSNMWGQKYQQALDEGADRATALNNAITYSVPAALVEIGGGVGASGKETQKLSRTILEEMGEEIVQDILSGISDKYTRKSDLPIFSMTEDAVINPVELAKTAAITAPVVAIGGAMNTGARAVVDMVRAEPITTQAGAAEGINAIGRLDERRTAQKPGESFAVQADKTGTGEMGAEQSVNLVDIEAEYKAAVDKELLWLIDYAVKNPSDNKTAYTMSDVSKRAARDIKRLTGIDVTGYGHNVKVNSLRHIVQGHGLAGTADRTFADITDIARMQYVIDNYDTVSLIEGAKSKEFRDGSQQPTPIIQYQKRINGNYYVVEAVPESSKKLLRVVTAYQGKAANRTLDANSPQLNAQSASGDAAFFNDSVPQGESPVNNSISTAADNDTQAGKALIPADDGIAEAPGLHAEQRAGVDAVAKRLGISYEWYNAESRPDLVNNNGAYENGKVLINEDAENPYMAVLGHEAFHRLGADERAGIIEFIKASTDTGADDFKAYRAGRIRTYVNEYSKSGKTFTEADFWEEYAAEHMENFITDEDFIRRLTRENRTLAQRVYDVLMSIIEKIGDVLTGKSYADTNDVISYSGMTDAELRKAADMYRRALRESTVDKGSSRVGQYLSRKMGGYFPDIKVSTEGVAKEFGIDNIHNKNNVIDKVAKHLKNTYLSTEVQSKPIINIDTGMEIEIWKGGIKETFGNDKYYGNLSAELKLAKVASIKSLAKLIKYGEVRSNEAKNRHNPQSKATYAYLAAPITIDNTMYTVNMDIRKSPQHGNKFYIHSLEIKTASQLGQGETPLNRLKDGSLSSPILAHDNDDVKTEVQIALEKAGAYNNIFKNGEKDTQRGPEKHSLKPSPAEWRIKESAKDAARIARLTPSVDNRGENKFMDVSVKTKSNGEKVYKFTFDSPDIRVVRKAPTYAEVMNAAEDGRYKDIGGLFYETNTPERVWEKVFDKDYEKVRELILNPLDDSKKPFLFVQEFFSNSMYDKVVRELGIKKGSRESELVQLYGEELLTLAELKTAAPESWQNIIEADKWFRAAYDMLINTINEKREQIYPHVEELIANAETDLTNVQQQIDLIELGDLMGEYDKSLLRGRQGDISRLGLREAELSRLTEKIADNAAKAMKRIDGQIADTKSEMSKKLIKDNAAYLKLENRVATLTERKLKLSAYADQKVTAKNELLQNVTQRLEGSKAEFDRAIEGLRLQLETRRGDLETTLEDEILWRGRRIPRRKNYYRHFQEMAEGMEGIINTIKAPANISSTLAGISANTKPHTKWASWAQKRQTNRTKFDAVGGFLNYIPTAAYAIAIDPNISVIRNFQNDLAKTTNNNKSINGFINYLGKYADVLSGKTAHPLDRWVQELVGRRNFRIINKVASRVKAGLILGNISSAVVQAANLPNAIARIQNPMYLIPAMGDTVSGLTDTSRYALSPFLSERYSDFYSKFDAGVMKAPKRMAMFMLEALDEVSTKYTWNAAYRKAVVENMADPVRYADSIARRTVGGRGVGEKSLFQEGKLITAIFPFTLEISNAWQNQGDMVREISKAISSKDSKGLWRGVLGFAVLYITNWMFNEMYKEMRGYDAGLPDPIGTTIESAQKDRGVVGTLGTLAGNALSSTTGGQLVSALYPEYGIRTGIDGDGLRTPTRKELFGSQDPTRYGTGNIFTGAMGTPLFSVILPWGGNQLRKTINGALALQKGGDYDKAGRLKYPLDKTDAVKALLYGKSATRPGTRYYNEELSPFSKLLTEYVDSAANRKEAYNEVLSEREKGNHALFKEVYKQTNRGEKVMRELETLPGYEELLPDITIGGTYKFTEDKKEVTLTPIEREKYRREITKQAIDMLYDLIISDDYRRAAPEEKTQMIKNKRTAIKNKAKGAVIKQVKK